MKRKLLRKFIPFSLDYFLRSILRFIFWEYTKFLKRILLIDISWDSCIEKSLRNVKRIILWELDWAFHVQITWVSQEIGSLRILLLILGDSPLRILHGCWGGVGPFWATYFFSFKKKEGSFLDYSSYFLNSKKQSNKNTLINVIKIWKKKQYYWYYLYIILILLAKLY